MLNKARGVNTAAFHPDTLAHFASQGQATAKPTFVGLEGLGKVPLANVRTPKHLIDLGSGEADVTG